MSNESAWTVCPECDSAVDHLEFRRVTEFLHAVDAVPCGHTVDVRIDGRRLQ